MLPFLLTSSLAAGAAALLSANATEAPCKCFPGDTCWPSMAVWDGLNSTVGGRLVATVPVGAPCHDPVYNADTCDYLQGQWSWEGVHINSSSSIMSPLFANQSCDPFQPEARTCELGNYVRYAINASGPADVQAGILFAKEKNIRFVIRNTGHDYHGRSTGAGALAIWTHYLKDIEFIDEWSDENYQGPAVKMGAGVQGYEIMAAGREEGLIVVGGECATVGISGGYTQGGGHSAISTSFGLSADNVLEWEVVTANGTLLTANSKENSDLFWALRGGGPSTYAVVISMTTKTHPDAVLGGATLAFYAAENSQDLFYEGIQEFHVALPDMVDAGTMVVYYFTDAFFEISPLNAYNKTSVEVAEILAPYLRMLDSIGINYTVAYTQFDTYYEHYDNYFGPLPQGNIQIGNALHSARFIPRSVAANISSTWQQVVEAGVTWIGVGVDVSPFGCDETTSVHPGWRDALVHASVTLPYNFTAPIEDMVAQADTMTNEIMPLIEAVTPNAGAYSNEGDFQQPDFQHVFWGTNYQKLLAIKKKYDPDNFFYARVTVGSEVWSVAEDGRMCRA